ncbi:Sas10/Utp3/C1D family-domain-containing protein [Aspergillus pseudotamarii]|uniref:Sas10/Utp3/C1D family-domain-containing protein n=1 Tax=Aspergillus pseudotamarii TaxID=132259 RepID=A0A5N6SGA5_ASPPS|nr:Sas10/Utp3/C1D family-domain-containing protein [Aspergillus pseudotamarii]KAE8133702.1 Sas10/Utp3/C1D family-domain-containing protein [Aspergillus pseudotamarii]
MATATQQPENSGLQNISALLETITGCLTTAGSSLPKEKRDAPSEVSIEPPQDGISLLDTKSDLLLSYTHNLVFLMLFQLRGLSKDRDGETEADQSLREETVKKLAELRVYLDRGVRPLEGRLKYQIDKVIKAAENVERTERTAAKTKATEAEYSGSEDESASEKGSSDGESDSAEGSDEDQEDIDEMAYRPNVSAFAKKVEPEARAERSTTKAPSDGIYRPPKIMPTALPTTETRERRERGPRRSTVIDEFVNAEMSSAPMAEPSIGSTIVHGGRHTKSKKEREHEVERTTYEETNFIRLAKESKKDRAKRGGQAAKNTYGGEEWRGLTEGADRISRLTRRAKGSGGALDRSRKRKHGEEGPRGDGAAVGQIFEKRRKKIEGWKR